METSTLSRAAFEDIIDLILSSEKIDVPMLPEVANKALVLSQNPDSNANQMANLIQSDQSLAGHVMRIANSAAYTPLSNLVSLQQAVSRLGMGVISEIALTASIGSKFFNTPGYENHVAKIWKHALATSLWAKEIARQCRGNVEVAFLSGLLHSIGRPTALQIILEQAKKHDLSLSENDVFELEAKYSQQVRDIIISEWKMPTLVIQAITGVDDENSVLASYRNAAVINAAISFAEVMLAPDSSSLDDLLMPATLTSLNLYQDDIDALLGNTEVISARLQGLSS